MSLARDVSDRKQDEALLDGQKRILELIIQGEPLLHVLSVLCRTIEDLAQGELLASVLLLDADGVHLRHGAAPSLPEGYNRAVDGLAIGPSVGSCGTAAYRGEPVYVSDIASDPLWAPYADFALSHGLRACWSTPILSSNAEVLGTFAMYYRQPRQPTPRDLRAVDIVTRTVAIAIEQSRAEQEVRESEERFRGTFENAAVGIAHVDVAGRFLRVNEKLCDIVGYTREELLAKTFQDITYSDDLEADLEQFMRLMRGDVPSLSRDKRYVRKDGSIVWVAVSVSLQRDAAGRPLYTISVTRDISHRKRLETEFRHAREVAEAANQAKDEFLANVSHEIRTPMNAILGMTDLVLDTPLTEDQWQCLKTVKSAADNLLGIINDLLDFSKIQAGKLELAPADFGLRAAVGDTVRALAMRAHSKGLELVCHVQPDVPDALVGDAGRLRQILLNLVSNAVKFTDQGEVVVGVSLDKETWRQGDKETESDTAPVSLSPCLLVFEVRDTGIGIPKDKQERVFRAFEQEDTSTTRKYGGTGLGLTIASRLVALMDGKITVDSAPGRGSTFAFTARFGLQPPVRERTEAPGAYATRLAPAPVMLRDLPVLIVDDNATNRHILEEWLRAWQMKPAAVGDGRAALDALSRGAACGRPYALVLLDARMPDTDGLALAAQVRKRAEWSATRIILLTSGDRPGDLARSQESRIDAHLLKPVQQEELLEAICRVMSRTTERMKDEGERMKEDKKRESGSDSSFILHPSSFPLRILVAEDNEFNAQLLEQLLVRRGHRVQIANNGRDALALLGIRSQKPEVRSQKSEVRGQKSEVKGEGSEIGIRRAVGGYSLASDLRPLASEFDLLLLDVHMPELDGFQVIQAVRDHERTTGGHLPVIALTARARREDRERCLAAGMDDFLAKPIQAVNLWAAIDRIARKDESGRMKDEGGRMKQDTKNESGRDSSFIVHPSSFSKGLLDPRSSILDPRALLAACGGDAIILEKICQAFRAGLPDHWKAVQDALQARDSPRLREAAHKLCGMVSAFSAVAGQVASELEDRAAQGLLEEARPLVGRLDAMVQELLQVVVGLSLDALREQHAKAAVSSNRTT